MENLTKDKVAVKVTDKNRKHIAKTLKMFGEIVYSASTINDNRNPYITFIQGKCGKWCNTSVIHYKTPISHKQLRTILAKEHLKEGDYVVCQDSGDTAVGVFKEFDEYGFELTRCRYLNGKYKDYRNTGGCFDHFKRYATPEEIEMLEGKKELEVGNWYFGELDNERKTLFCFSGEYGQFTQYGFNVKGEWSNQLGCIQGLKYIEATPQEVESALTDEAIKRGHKYEKFVYNSEENTLCGYNGRLEEVFVNGKWNEPINKFAELKELPKPNVLVWAKRKDGVYLAKRNGNPRSKNQDPSINCDWNGIRFDEIKNPSDHNSGVHFPCYFSDITVEEWRYTEQPKWNEDAEYRIKPEEKPKVVWKESLIREAHNYEISTNQLVKLCHGLAKDAGWHDKHREVGTMLALIHSEVSEAMEGFRKDLNDDHLTHRKMAEVELADAVIRIFDLAGSQGFDLGGALVEKLVYNTQRADHKIENRQGENGKKF